MTTETTASGFQWFVLHTLSGQEQKVKDSIEKRMKVEAHAKRGRVSHPGFDAHFHDWEGGIYAEETKAKAMRLVVDHADDYPSEYDAIRAVSARLGMNPETLRKWLRQAEIDSGQRDGVTTTSAREIRELKRKNAELERTIEILKEATSFFVRESDPQHR